MNKLKKRPVVRTVTKICKGCKQPFKLRLSFHTVEEADAYKKQNDNTYGECEKCYALRCQREKPDSGKNICASLGLPKINAVSEKQLRYADMLRNGFVEKNADIIKIYAALFQSGSARDIIDLLEVKK